MFSSFLCHSDSSGQKLNFGTVHSSLVLSFLYIETPKINLTHCTLITKTNRLILVQMIAVYSSNYSTCIPSIHSVDKIQFFNVEVGDRGSTVVKVLHYKSEGRWFDSR